MPKRVQFEKLPELAILDTARYQEQLLRLIIHHDDRALRTLSLYVTVVGAITTACFALYGAGLFGPYIAIFSGTAVISLLVGCFFAYRAAWTAPIYLPGRKPEFWQWAHKHNIAVHEAIAAYLLAANDVIQHNEKISDRAAKRLGRGYVCGLAAPVFGLICAAFVYITRNVTWKLV